MWGLIQQAIDWFGGIGDDIRNLVKTAVSWVISYIEARIGDVVGWINAVWNYVVPAATFLWSVVQQAWGLANHILQIIVPFLEDAINGAMSLARSLVDGVWSWLAQFASNVWRGIQQAVDVSVSWVIDNVFNPLHGFILALINDVLAAARWTYDNVIAPTFGFLWRAIDDLITFVSDAVQWVESAGKFIQMVIGKCWDWLVFFATHPFNWFFILIADVTGRAASWWLGQMLSWVAREGDHVDEWFSRWLGT